MNREQVKQWLQNRSQFRQGSILSKPLIMGILNLTPDSFSDGGQYSTLDKALNQAHKMIADGADIIDVGGESTRPGALPISCSEELARVLPLIKQLSNETTTCISIDTNKAQVMHASINAGAAMINDISFLAGTDSLAAAAELQVPLCLMHMQGNPGTMQQRPHYVNHVVDEINDFFQQKIELCHAAGILSENIILDPGFGFGKNTRHNLLLVKEFAKFKQHQLPLMLGVSRKNTIGAVLNCPVEDRLIGSLALTVYAALEGVNMIRTHDVAATNQALLMVQAIEQAN